MNTSTESNGADVRRLPANPRAFLVGGGVGSLAAAAFLIRDGYFLGHRITIYETQPAMGGSLDGGGNAHEGYRLRGGRMFTTDNYECTWELFKSIPSLDNIGQSVYEETLAFNQCYKSHAKARLIDRNGAIVDVESMGFSMQDRIALFKFIEADETMLGSRKITDYLSPAFFETNFWLMWQTTFAFQPWHSAIELRRYLHRFMLEFSRIDTLAGVKRTVYNQYDSLVKPLVQWLANQGVQLLTRCFVNDIEISTDNDVTSIAAIHTFCGGQALITRMEIDDLVFLQNGSMTDASSFGSMTTSPQAFTRQESAGWALWEKLATGRAQFGNPSAFNSDIPKSVWESFTVTLKDSVFFNAMERLSGNAEGTGGLVTFKDSNWLMSIVLPHQPHFREQPAGVQVFWGYGLHPERIGNYLSKTMAECNGAEILAELCGHLQFDAAVAASGNCIPCRMPYITSMFMPRVTADRPVPVPVGSRNLALISQFVEIPHDVVFTVEYSVRAAQMAVYQLLKLDLPIPPIKHHDASLRVKLDALIKAFK